MCHGDDALGDDGAFVEAFGDVVGGGADDFDSALKGLFVGTCSDKGREKGVVDVEDFLPVGFDEAWREHPHVFGKDQVVQLVFMEYFQYFVFVLLAGFAFMGDMVKGNIEFFGQGFEGVVVADDALDVGADFVVGGPD